MGMGELWQAYGSWILYAVIALGMLWMHGGLGRRSRHGGAHGHDRGHAQRDLQDPRAAAASSAAPAAADQDRGGHSHGKGCC